MLPIGCIQAQRCHTGHCPAGVTTHSRWRQRGLVPELKARRLASYVVALREELGVLARAWGVAHPALVTGEHFELLDGTIAETATVRYGLTPGWGLPSLAEQEEGLSIMAHPAGART